MRILMETHEMVDSMIPILLRLFEEVAPEVSIINNNDKLIEMSKKYR